MQQHNGLAIIYNPNLMSRKRLHFHTWLAQYQSKRHPFFESLIAQRLDANNQSYSSNQSNMNMLLNVNAITNSNNYPSAPTSLSRPSSSHGERLATGKDRFSRMPHEIMMNIFEHLEPTEIISLSMVNKMIRLHTQDNYLWRQILLREYGDVAIQEESRKMSANTKEKRKKSKSARKQSSIKPNWKDVFMRLSTVNVSTKTAIFKGRPGAFYKYRNFDFKDNDKWDTNNCNQIRQKQRSYTIEMTISNVPPGVYDVIWRMKIEKSSYKPVVIFNTDVWLRHNIYLSSYQRETKFYYAPDSDDFSRVIDKGWFNFRLPFKVVIARKEQSVDYRYQVHTGINCHLENDQSNEKNSGKPKNKGPFSVDSVCLRPHIAYDLINVSPTFKENRLPSESPLLVEASSEIQIIDESLCRENDYSEYDKQASVDGDVRSCGGRGSCENRCDEKGRSKGGLRKKEYIKKVFLCAGSPGAHVE